MKLEKESSIKIKNGMMEMGLQSIFKYGIKCLEALICTVMHGRGAREEISNVDSNKFNININEVDNLHKQVDVHCLEDLVFA
ncbi:uncharacterized protein LOC128033772 isoform X2 [Gossypium raimondii]|uniref:uncharacterized protein LOC128033772 isoform X2 n=1 Tax=Gossypium raimondii TaxID=29730 RepID=UPI002279F6B4|nr:uncharacterized protein LOC128033772 isoform X2 [Gossypium raimondii]